MDDVEPLVEQGLIAEPGAAAAGLESHASTTPEVQLGDRSLAAKVRYALSGYTLVGAVLVAVVLIVSIAAPLVAGHDPEAQDSARRLMPPAFLHGGHWSHVLGTDGLGRDLWARIVFGLRTSLLIAVPAVAIAATLGVAIGISAGYFGGLINAILMRLTDVQMAFPFIILAVTLLSVFQPGPLVLIVVLSLSVWPTYARIVRSIALVDAKAEYVLAARAMGASHLRILIRYILRNIWISILILSTLDLAGLIILEALLSFIGLGIQPPGMSLGTVMADGKDYVLTGVWGITTFPGVTILVVLLGLNILGDGLQKKFDPRLKGL
jgi:peptide/nickel transport system permease protein